MSSTKARGRRRWTPNLDPPRIQADYIEEPSLAFGCGREHVDPKNGLACFGPRTLDDQRHPGRIQIGFIGSGTSIASARSWLSDCAQAADADPASARL